MGMRSVNTTADPHGTRSGFRGVTEAAVTYARGGTVTETFSVLDKTAREQPAG
jgi:hypothetical protein